MRSLQWILTVLLGITSVLWFCLIGCFGLLTFTGLADEPTSVWTFWRSATFTALSLFGVLGFLASLWLAQRLRRSEERDVLGPTVRGFEVKLVRRPQDDKHA